MFSSFCEMFSKQLAVLKGLLGFEVHLDWILLLPCGGVEILYV